VISAIIRAFARPIGCGILTADLPFVSIVVTIETTVFLTDLAARLKGSG
jgi:hypothetical protein